MLGGDSKDGCCFNPPELRDAADLFHLKKKRDWMTLQVIDEVRRGVGGGE